MSNERDQLAAGGAEIPAPDPDPYDLAEQAALGVRKRGGTSEDEATAWLGQVAKAALAGDKRVILDSHGMRHGNAAQIRDELREEVRAEIRAEMEAEQGRTS